MSSRADETEIEPTWRRIVNFPLIALVISVVIYVAAATLGGLLGRPLEPLGQPLRPVLRAVITIGVVLLAYKFLITRLGDERRDDLRLSGRAGRDLLAGAALGALIMALAVGVAALLGVYRIIGEGDTSQLIRQLIALAILPAFMEELLFRGILFRWVEEFAGSWAALVFTSALFGVAHIINPNATWFSSLAIAIEAGVLLGGAYMLTRSLWLPIGLHAGWNFTQGEVFDVPVSGLDQNGLVRAQLSGPPLLSGGEFGLEASVICLVLATAAGLAMIVLALHRGRLVRPAWVRSQTPAA